MLPDFGKYVSDKKNIYEQIKEKSDYIKSIIGLEPSYTNLFSDNFFNTFIDSYTYYVNMRECNTNG